MLVFLWGFYGAGVNNIPIRLISGVKRNKIFIINKNTPMTIRQKTNTAKAKNILKAVSILKILIKDTRYKQIRNFRN